jgi:hypothetical protein
VASDIKIFVNFNRYHESIANFIGQDLAEAAQIVCLHINGKVARWTNFANHSLLTPLLTTLLPWRGIWSIVW